MDFWWISGGFLVDFWMIFDDLFWDSWRIAGGRIFGETKNCGD